MVALVAMAAMPGRWPEAREMVDMAVWAATLEEAATADH